MIVFHLDEPHEEIPRRPGLGVHLLVDFKGFFIIPYEKGVKADLSMMDLINSSGSYQQPEKIGERKLKQQQVEIRLVVVFIGRNCVVKQEDKENDRNPDNGGEGGLPHFNKTASSENIVVEACYVIKQKPCRGYKDQTDKILPGKFYGDIVSELGRFNDFLPEDVKQSPTDCSSQEIKEYVKCYLSFLIHKNVPGLVTISGYSFSYRG
jgi:hypothetical protein